MVDRLRTGDLVVAQAPFFKAGEVYKFNKLLDVLRISHRMTGTHSIKSIETTMLYQQTRRSSQTCTRRVSQDTRGKCSIIPESQVFLTGKGLYPLIISGGGWMCTHVKTDHRSRSTKS